VFWGGAAKLAWTQVGYGAFLAGPPLLGFLGSHFGVLHALLIVSVLLIPSAFAVPAARRQEAPAA
jgi:hypothetical protein